MAAPSVTKGVTVEKQMQQFRIRVHTSDNTIDIPMEALNRSTVEGRAEVLASNGCWNADKTKFYPPKEIVYVELKDL
jgi:hypothetical protein